jgi:hypothetical protein
LDAVAVETDRGTARPHWRHGNVRQIA